jgi:putative ABC transport system substrate-binding protein
MQFDQFKRRELIALVGGVAAWPLAARAQQHAMPVIGLLASTSPDTNADNLRAFHLGLKEAGYIEGENVSVIYRWADHQLDRMPALATDLVGRRVAVIAAFAGGAIPAKAATTTIPIVFMVPEDPVKLGLVASIARPGGNLTGINFVSGELVAKRLELLRQVVPTVHRVAVLVHPSAISAESTLRDVEATAHTMGLKLQILGPLTSSEIDATYASLARERTDAVFVANAPFFTARRVQLSLLAMRHQIPAIYSQRGYVEAGGLISYGGSLQDTWRQVGVYTGRVLKGAKPADLPVVQASKFELVINHQTARMLGLTVPPTLLAIADEVIE